MKREMLTREVGNWVEGERFWDREVELASLVELLDDGANVLLAAQRRTGKTSLMRETANQIGARYVCLQVDFEKCHSAADAVTEIGVATRPHFKLWGKTKEIFGNFFSSLGEQIDELSIHEVSIKLRDGLSAHWQAKADALLGALATMEQPVVLFIDELPILVNRMLKGDEYQITPARIREADAFLSWLRSMTILHKGKIRFVVTGSIGLEPILRQAGLSATANTFTPFELNPWSTPIAVECIQALARRYSLTFEPGAEERMADRLGACVPHHVQLFFSHIYEDCKRRAARTCGRADVDRVYETSMLSTRGHAELSHFEERLKMVLGPELMPLALDLLTEVAVVGTLSSETADLLWRDFRPDGGSGASILREILGVLEHDGYLKKAGNAFVFVSALLRDWWNARFSLAFRPAARRGR